MHDARLLSSMTEIKQMAESPRAKPTETVSTGEPAQVAAGRAGAAAITAAQKGLLKQLQAAKESLRPGDGTSAPPNEADRERTDKRPEHNRNWIPWIIGACLAGGALAYISRNMRQKYFKWHCYSLRRTTVPNWFEIYA